MEDFYYSDMETWDIIFSFESFNDSKVFMGEMDNRYDSNILTGLNFFFIEPNIFLIGCVFSKKVDIYELDKLAKLFKGERREIPPKEQGDWILYFVNHSKFSACGDGYKTIKPLDENQFEMIVHGAHL
jgi:hypothetical protein